MPTDAEFQEDFVRLVAVHEALYRYWKADTCQVRAHRAERDARNERRRAVAEAERATRVEKILVWWREEKWRPEQERINREAELHRHWHEQAEAERIAAQAAAAKFEAEEWARRSGP